MKRAGPPSLGLLVVVLLFFFGVFLAACEGDPGATGPAGKNGADGTTGETGKDGQTGEPGPSLPILQSIDARGLPAEMGGTVTLVATARSATSSTLTYAWSVSPSTWLATDGADTDTVTLTAPRQLDSKATASVVVTDSEGRATTGAISIETKSGRWGAPTPLPKVLKDGFEPDVGMDGNGNAMVVWEQLDAGVSHIWVNRFTAATGRWNGAGRIEWEPGEARGPRIAMNHNITATTWLRSDGVDDHVAVRIGQTVLIENLAGTSSQPIVAAIPSRVVLVVWVQRNASASTVYASRYTSATNTWGTPVALSTSTAQPQRARLALSDDGTAFAVWEQHDGATTSIYASRYAASTWGAAVLLEAGAGAASSADVAMNSNGRAMATWTQYDSASTSYRTYAALFNGSVWGGAILLGTSYAASIPTVAMPLGTLEAAAALWLGSNGHYYASRYGAGTWGTAVQLETYPSSYFVEVETPRAAMDGEGDATFVFARSDGSTHRIYGCTWPAGGSLGLVGPLETWSDTGTTPRLAIDGRGTATAVWSQRVDGLFEIQGTVFDGTVWSEPSSLQSDFGTIDDHEVAAPAEGPAVVLWRQAGELFVTREDASPWEPVTRLDSRVLGIDPPKVAVDPTGAALAVWIKSDPSIANVYASRSLDGTTWEAPRPLEALSGQTSSVDLAMGADGSGVATWRQDDGSYASIYANRFSGTDWEGAVRIQSATGSTGEPRATVDAQGSAMVVWLQNDGSAYRFYSNHFAGTSWGTAVPVTGSEDGAYHSQVAFDEGGGAWLAWSREGDGVYVSAWSATTGWAEPVAVGASEEHVDRVQLARADDGTAVVLWTEDLLVAGTIVVTTYLPSEGWGAPRTFHYDRTSPRSLTPQLGVAPSGNVWLVWTYFAGSDYRVLMTHLPPGGEWTLPEALDTSSMFVGSPKVSVGRSGEVHVVWRQDDGSWDGLWSVRLR